jgi:hypothetical protein
MMTLSLRGVELCVVVGNILHSDPRSKAGVIRHSNEMKPEIVNFLVKAFEYSSIDVEMPVFIDKMPSINNSQSKEPSPVVIFSHGRPGSLAARAAQKNPVNLNIVRYWHTRGYSVVAAVRPGYGDNAAVDPEDSGTKWNGDTCSGSGLKKISYC